MGTSLEHVTDFNKKAVYDLLGIFSGDPSLLEIFLKIGIRILIDLSSGA